MGCTWRAPGTGQTLHPGRLDSATQKISHEGRFGALAACQGLGPAGLSGGAVRPGLLGHPQQADPLAGAPAGVGVSGGCLEEPVSGAVGSSDRMENAFPARDSATR